MARNDSHAGDADLHLAGGADVECVMFSRLLDALGPWKWLLLAGLVPALVGYHYLSINSAKKAAYAAGDTAGAARVQKQYDAFKGELITKSAQLIRDAYHANDGLIQSFATREKEFKDAEKRIADERDAALASLHERPERPAGGAGGNGDGANDTADTAAASGSTGAELYRQDAAFLVREAARAELIRTSLIKCYTDIDQARGAGAIHGRASAGAACERAYDSAWALMRAAGE